MPVLRAWWRDSPDAATRWWSQVLGRSGSPPWELSPPLVEELVVRQLAAPAMLCVLPLQDWLAMDADLRRADPDAEQINQPADRHHRWRYRLHLTTAQLHAAEAFTEHLRSLVAASGRLP